VGVRGRGRNHMSAYNQMANVEIAAICDVDETVLNAGLAAEAVGDKVQATSYYSALLESTDNGSQSARPEFEHVKAFVSAAAVMMRPAAPPDAARQQAR